MIQTRGKNTLWKRRLKRFSVERQLSDLSGNISSEDKAEPIEKLENLRACTRLDDVDLEELRKQTKELQDKSWRVSQEAYQSTSSEK